STGKPKGVMVPHRAVVNFLESMRRTPGIDADDVLVAVTTLSFDIAVLELMLPLTVGAQVVLADRDAAMDGHALAELLERSNATLMQATPSTWRALLDAGWLGDLAFTALCGGEPMSPGLAAQLRGRCKAVWNMYGPTETTVWSTCWRVEHPDEGVSIGTPIANTQVWVLDEQRQPCPIGVPGELWIGGDGVTLGYLHRPELTAERFVPDPFRDVPGARLYRTGDRGRWKADGTLEHLGRLDFQVKVRGYRIELGEIEAQLALQPGVARAVAITREDRPGDVRIVAYLVAQPGTALDEAALRQALRRLLPEYMVPQHFLVLQALPLLPNGKLDRKALPAPADLAHETGTHADFVAPRDDLERTIAAEMEAVLALPGLGVDDNFFELGGHSLLAAQLTARLNKALGLALPLRTLFEAPTVARLAEAVRAASAEPAHARRAARVIPRRADRARAPLSLMQQRLWFLEELDPGRVVYNTPSAHRLLGPMDERAFERAFNALIRRQPVLRTTIVKENGEPVQAILPQLEVTLFPAEDLSALEPAAREALLQRRIAELTAQPFELVGAPLFRTHMFRLGAEEHVLFFMIHHLIWDGWSFDVFYEEMAALYPAACEGRDAELPELAVDYGDFAAWHREWMQGEELAAQLAHWRKLLADVPEPLELPSDRPRPPRMSGVGRNAWIRVDKPAVDALRELARRADATLYMALLALYYVMLCRHTGQRDLVVGTPVRGRDAPELEPVMGFFVNALPLRMQVDPQASFLDLLRAVRAVVVDAFSYPDVPFEHLLRALQLPRDESRFPIYQALFSFQDIRKRPEQWGALRHGRVQVMQPGAAEDLGLWFVEMEDGLRGGLGYNTDILEHASVERMRDRYLALLQAALADPQQAVGRLPLLPETERRQLEAWNATAAPYAADALMHEAFEAQAARAPLRVAVRFGERSLSYGELEARANRIAHALRARGVRRGALVGLCLQRGPDMLAALLGVLKSGAGYVPLDPAYPRERLAFMAEDAGLAELVTTSDLTALIDRPRERILLLDGDIPDALPTAPPRRDDAAAAPDSIAYVIYTSG
ncbi:condensation domain-containing protein, partial [Mizugakiibacter sediminis]|uniref:condensation domain-containing protein n=1 Tax=Mizugakiibacter sediminis TaxID=1475481 RepID=UPI00191C8B0B